MEVFFLQGKTHLGNIKEYSGCKKCGKIFAILRIIKVEDEESDEDYYEAYIDEDLENVPCPYCAQEEEDNK